MCRYDPTPKGSVGAFLEALFLNWRITIVCVGGRVELKS